MQQKNCLFISTNVTPQKRDGRNCVFEVFSQGLEEMHQELSKDGERFTWRIFYLFFVLVWFLFWDHHYHFIYDKATGNKGWNILHAFIVLGKGMSKLIFNDTYSSMIHGLLMSNNMQMLYHELSFIHVLKMYVISPCLTWIS